MQHSTSVFARIYNELIVTAGVIIGRSCYLSRFRYTLSNVSRLVDLADLSVDFMTVAYRA